MRRGGRGREMKRAHAAALAACLLTAFAPAAHACSCGSPSLRSRFRHSDAVFIGKVVEMSPVQPSEDFPLAVSVVRFEVERRWKGARGREVAALADFDSPGMCGDLKLAVGERYLIFAPREKGRLRVYTDCGPNRDAGWDQAADEMKRLDGFWFRFGSRFYPYPKL